MSRLQAEDIPIPLIFTPPLSGEPAVDETAWLPMSFWGKRSTLEQVARLADARGLSRDAVLGSFLARTSALIPPTLVLPPIDGAPASLNFFAVVVAESGHGKSAANRVAAELLPDSALAHARVHSAPSLGSAEGLVEQFFDWKDEIDESGKPQRIKARVHDSLFVRVDEATRLTELAGRKGSTMLSTLLAIWSGENPGTTGASEETTRNLPPMKYRAGVVVNYQPGVAQELLKQAGIGLPQRFVVFNANPQLHLVEPRQRERIDNPEPIKWQHRPVVAGQAGNQPQIDVPDKIRYEVQQDRYERQKGYKEDTDGLGGHATLSRLKLAALFGALEGRWSIDSADWELALTVMETSHRNWQLISQRTQKDQQSRNRANANRRAAEAVAAEDALAERHRRITESAFTSMARKAHRDKHASRSDVFKAINSRYRAELRKQNMSQSEIVEAAIDEGVIQDTDSGWEVSHEWLE